MKKTIIGAVALAGLAGYAIYKEIGEALEDKKFKKDLDNFDKENFENTDEENKPGFVDIDLEKVFGPSGIKEGEDSIFETEESKKEAERILNRENKDTKELKSIQEELAILSEIKQRNELLSLLAGKDALEIKIGDLTIDERISFLEEMLMNKVNQVDTQNIEEKVNFPVEDVFRICEKTFAHKGFVEIDFNNLIPRAKEFSEHTLKELEKYKKAEIELDLVFKKNKKDRK